MGRPAVLKVDIVADARGVGAGVAEADRKFAGLAGTMRKHGKAIAIGAGAAAAGIVKLGADAIRGASDLAETTSKVNVLFGSQGKTIQAFAKNAATSLGQTQQEALDAAATFATFGKSAGLTGSNLAGFSTKLTGLASDMASFSNTSPQEAIEAIGAALRGESEPIRKYGVMLNDATLKNEALKLGLIRTTTEALTPQQKVLAAQAAIMAQTTAAQGDFARTSDGLANKQRILHAQLTNVSTQLGASLLPIMLRFVKTLSSVVTWSQANATWLKPVVLVLGSLAAVVFTINKATKAWAAAQAALNVVMALNPVGLVVIAIAALAAGVVLAYKKSDTFRAGVDKLWTLLKKLVGFSPFGLILTHLDDIWRKVKDVGDAIKHSPLGKLGNLDLNPFSGPVLGMTPQLVGGSPGLGTRPRIATAALGTGSGSGLGVYGGGSLAGVVVVDRRTIDARVTIQGAVDPVSTAEQLSRVLDARDVRLGKVSAWGGTGR